jgi:hypothetical protein
MKEQKYEKYREAWHLLLDGCKGGSEGTVDIQACCEEEMAGDAKEVMGRAAVRKMFRGVFQEAVFQG